MRAVIEGYWLHVIFKRVHLFLILSWGLIFWFMIKKVLSFVSEHCFDSQFNDWLVIIIVCITIYLVSN